jgi:predicted dehydrogenase
LNATPPAVHGLINQQAFDQRVPVLCEKPISDDYASAVQMVERAVREHIPFAIAENYRFAPSARQVKALIDQGVIGEPAAIRVDFYRSYRTEKDYFVNMDDPLLVDVTIHHFDLVRYFTGAEGKRIFAQSYRPPGSVHRGNMALDFWLEMESRCVVNYHGTLAARAAETTWLGDWRIEGTRGAIQLTQDRVDVIQNGRVTAIEPMRAVRPPTCLDEFILSLAEHRPAETSAVDYLRTQALVHVAQQAHRLRGLVEVERHSPGAKE